jgi:pimeloyl-ACP methyl ester carboxylesterase
MTERIADAGRGILLAYEELGDAGADPLVLVAGLGQQVHSWPTAFCERLAARGYRVIRFDNRDVGRSTHLRFRPPGPVAMLARRRDPQQYDLTDLATDTVMVAPTRGAATVRAITGARLETIRGMGHDLPEGAWPRLLDLIDDHAHRRRPAAPTTTP